MEENKERNDRIRALRAQGLKHAQIAREMGISQSRVNQILRPKANYEHYPVGPGHVFIVDDDPTKAYAGLTFNCGCGNPDCTWVGSSDLSRYNAKEQ